MNEPQADGSLRWRLSDYAGEAPQFYVPRAALARLGLATSTECTVQLPGGAAFESELVVPAPGEGGSISAQWPAMRDALRLLGGETVSLRAERRIVLHLKVEQPADPQVHLRKVPGCGACEPATCPCRTRRAHLRACVALKATISPV